MKPITKMFIIIFFLFAFCTFAQTKVGLQIGFSSSGFDVSDRPTDFELKKNNNFTIGGTFNYDFHNNFSIIVEPQFITRGEGLVWNRIEDDFKYETDLKYIDLPIYLAYKFSMEKVHPYFFAGINFSVLLNAEISSNQNNEDQLIYDADDFSNFNFSPEGGVGFAYILSELYEVRLSFKYSYGLLNIYTEENNIKSNNFQVSVAILYSLL